MAWAAAQALVFLGVLALGCHRESPSQEPLIVFAAASTSEPVAALAKIYENETGSRPRIAVGASSDLARQIKAGAPADLFLSADEAQMDGLDRAGLIDKPSRRSLLSNRLVVVVPRQVSERIRSARDLVELQRIALADPQAVPAGVYAREWLESLGLWSSISSKVIPSFDVRAALSAVDTGAVDAAIVYKTDAAVAKTSRIAFEVPADKGPKIVYSIAKVARSRNPGAERFLRLVTSSVGREVFTRYGFVFLVPAKVGDHVGRLL